MAARTSGASLGWPSARRALCGSSAGRLIEVGEVVLGLALVEIGLAGEEVTLDIVEGTADPAGGPAGLRCLAVALVRCAGRRPGCGPLAARCAGLALARSRALGAGAGLGRAGRPAPRRDCRPRLGRIELLRLRYESRIECDRKAALWGLAGVRRRARGRRNGKRARYPGGVAGLRRRRGGGLDSGSGARGVRRTRGSRGRPSPQWFR